MVRNANVRIDRQVLAAARKAIFGRLEQREIADLRQSINRVAGMTPAAVSAAALKIRQTA
jgi:hypothetical protein